MQGKVVLLGDSITQGLGSKKINFTGELQNRLGDKFQVENMALTGTTIHYAEEILPKILESKPEYVVVVYGNVDAQIRPNRKGKIFKHIPKRFQGNGMLMPRPFYSHDLRKKTGQKIENIIRHILSNLIYAIDGTEQWVSVEEFSQCYQTVVHELQNENIKVIACSTVYIDENLFPGSLAQYEKINEKILDIASQYNTVCVDLFHLLEKQVEKDGWGKRYCYDHFHPNGGGYKIIANILAEKILQYDNCLSKE